jgi:hypothetical protein
VLGFLYTVWLRDDTLLPEDEDHEWPCCFVIVAGSEAEALAWGDHLATDYCARCTCTFLRSHAEPVAAGVSGSLPRVPSGVTMSDDAIGW